MVLWWFRNSGYIFLSVKILKYMLLRIDAPKSTRGNGAPLQHTPYSTWWYIHCHSCSTQHEYWIQIGIYHEFHGIYGPIGERLLTIDAPKSTWENGAPLQHTPYSTWWYIHCHSCSTQHEYWIQNGFDHEFHGNYGLIGERLLTIDAPKSTWENGAPLQHTPYSTWW